jgi:hypothetical protein
MVVSRGFYIGLEEGKAEGVGQPYINSSQPRHFSLE